jgi:DNA-binding transcriptional MerR regulator
MRKGVIRPEKGPLQFRLQPKAVGELFNISYRQIQYWDTSGFIKPSCSETRSSTKYRLYNFKDLIVIFIIRALQTNRKQTVQRLRRLVKVLRQQISRAGPYIEGAILAVIPEPKKVVDRVILSYVELHVNDPDTWNGKQSPVKEIRDKIEKALCVGKYAPPKGLSAAQANRLKS